MSFLKFEPENEKEAVLNESMDCAEIFMQALRSIEDAEKRLRQVRQKATDLVMPGEEDIKRSFITEVDNMIDMTANAARLLHLGPQPAKDFRDELLALLSVRIPDLVNASAPAVVQEILLERANQAGQAYQSRVVREEV